MCKADQVLLLLKAIYWPLLACMCAKSPRSCPTLCDSVDCSQPGSSVHRILQARTLEWVAVPSSRLLSSVQVSSVAQLCLTLDCSTPAFPVHHQLPELAQTPVHQVSDAIQPSHPLSPLLLLPSVFPSIGVFSSESVLHIRWPKYWSFSFSISSSSEYPGLISFRVDWFDLFAVQGPGSSLTQNPKILQRP